jgi:two-component system response regulator AtoC
MRSELERIDSKRSLVAESENAATSLGSGSQINGRRAPDPCFAQNLLIREIEESLDRIALSDVPVLVQGETGVGKELLAKRLHAHSRRAERPFLKLNCAALPSELVESELFGCARGAYTGAIRDRSGKFEMANGGTILLDEIGDMHIQLQAKLLQVLQDGEFLRLGSEEKIRVDVRVIAATHCNLTEAIDQGRFREDLYYRLNVIGIQIPPLRERREEILSLTQHLLAKHVPIGAHPPKLGIALQRALLEYDWPGNVRELENMMRKLLVMGREDLLIRDMEAKMFHRPARVSRVLHEQSVQPREEPSLLKKGRQAKNQVELDAILIALKTTQWNRKQAAMLLNTEYKTFLYKMKKLGITSARAARIA